MARRQKNGKELWLTGGLLRFARHRDGTVALEFAITGLAFVALVLFVIILGFRLYVQVALDYASSRAARLLAVDSTQSRSGNAANFQVVSFCPLISAFLACNNLTLSLQPVTDFRNASSLGGTTPPPFSPGQGGSLMLFQVTYRLPTLSWPMPTGGVAGSFAGATVTVGYPFQNEY